MPPPRLVLAGSALPHLTVLEAVARGRLGQASVTMIAERPVKACAAMLAGLVAGRYRPGQASLALGRLAKAAGADFIEGRVAGVDPEARALELSDGLRVPYDVASLGIGSVPAGAGLPGVAERACFATPIANASTIAGLIDEALTRATADGIRVVVVGGGREGVEVALAIRRRLLLAGRDGGIVTAVDAGPALLPGYGTAASAAAMAALARNGVSVILGGSVVEVSDRKLLLNNGARVPFDVLVWAAGIEPPDLFARSGLTVDRRGFLQVDGMLRAIGWANLFGAGRGVVVDQQQSDANPMAGQGKVLAANLAAVLAGRPPAARVKPPSTPRALINTGDGHGILIWRGLTFAGRWVMVMKDWSDRRLVERFKKLGS